MDHILHVCLSFSETSGSLNLGIDCYFNYSWYVKICIKLYKYLLLLNAALLSTFPASQSLLIAAREKW